MLKRTRNLFLIPGYPVFLSCMMLQGMAISISSPFLAVYFTTKLGVSAGTFGIFTAITIISGVWLSMWIAQRSDSGLNRKKLMVTAMFFNALAFAGYLLIHEFYGLLLYMAVFTALGAPAMPQLFASAREAVNASKSADHAFANSTLRSMFSLGFIAGPLAGSALIHYFGFPGIFMSTVLIFLMNALLIMIFVKAPAAPPQTAGSKQQQQPVRLLQNSRVLIPFLVLTLLYSGHWINNLNISLFITDTLGGDTQNVASVSSICALLEIPLMLVLGLLSAKYSARLLMVWGITLGAAYYIVVLFSTSLWQILAGQVLLAFFVAVISAIGISYIQDLLPDLPGYASTLYTNSTTIGRLFGSLAGGAAAQWFGYRNAYWVCLLLGMVSLALLALPRHSAAEEAAHSTSIT
ncbi:sugar efflux transporter [Paenibacillus riograndensis]|uniref:Permease of the major facilitator superfamily protein n=1 Tax=Paenibacillus riograndensis SBR5 TaxID=1073571 RepID=A0A0E4HC40_9BACL|nr:sugar efflux transporter [Paenibacillus riograndensis]CQR54252.1 Permease of the major facilitator superfamily protein [Paenibacillus riograndensis SBR5]